MPFSSRVEYQFFFEPLWFVYCKGVEGSLQFTSLREGLDAEEFLRQVYEAGLNEGRSLGWAERQKVQDEQEKYPRL